MNIEANQSVEPGFIYRRLKFPLLDRDDRVALAERVSGSSSTDADFVVMMTLAVVLASLGLMQGATAVVIGAMLVAPLMGPLLGAGLAVTQGNLKLFRHAFAAIAIGVGIGFVVSAVVGLLNPGLEPSLEIEARGNPDLFDLGIAFAAGMAAAYAQGRPNVIRDRKRDVVGHALTCDRALIAADASILLVTNLIAITLGAALMFRMLGMRVTPAEQAPTWARRAAVLLVMGAILLAAPLLLNTMAQKQGGQARPMTYPVAPVVRKAVRDHLGSMTGIDVITMGRPSVEPELGITIVLESQAQVTPSFIEGVQAVVREARGEAVPVQIHVLRSARSETATGTETASR